jgi:uncharacterized protein (DUF2164 family)
MERREKLIHSALQGDTDETKARMLNQTVDFILGDMGSMYYRFWQAEGPGVLCFQPKQEKSLVYLTLEELNSAKEAFERDNKHDLVETFRRILEAAQKINSKEKAGYLINDEEGIRYLEIDYNKGTDKK